MQRTSKHLSVFAIVACVVAVLAFGGTAAFAAGNWWNPPEGGNTLNVGITNDDTLKEDLLKANVVVDLYKVADAEADESFETFNYTMVEDFYPAESDSDEVKDALTIKSDPTNDDWDAMAEAAADKIAGVAPAASFPMNEAGEASQNGLADGLYLVVAHGEGQDPLYAASSMYGYRFLPILVALPGKARDDSGAIRTDDSYGAWLTNVSIVLKPSQEPLYGSLRIQKTVDNFYGEPATFVFHIVSTDDSPFEYDNYASVYYTGGEPAETTATHIKAGTVVTVTEVYPGGRFEPVGEYQNISPGKAIVADDQVTDDNPIASVSFANHQITDIGGHGIENNFTLGEDGDWVITVTPADALQNPETTEE